MVEQKSNKKAMIATQTKTKDYQKLYHVLELESSREEGSKQGRDYIQAQEDAQQK